MSKNIFLSGIYHETHTFLGEPTTLKDFIIFHDKEIINENTGNGSPTDGFIEYASLQNWNIIPGKLVAPDHAPGYIVRQFSISIYDLAALIGIGGICIFAMCRSMKKAEPIPVRDPNILTSINYTE